MTCLSQGLGIPWRTACLNYSAVLGPSRPPALNPGHRLVQPEVPSDTINNALGPGTNSSDRHAPSSDLRPSLGHAV